MPGTDHAIPHPCDSRRQRAAIRRPARSCRRSIWPPRSCSPAPASGASSTTRAAAIPRARRSKRRWRDLEGGVGGLAFASGMAATHCVDACCWRAAITSWPAPTSTAARIALLHKIVNRAGIGVSLAPTTDLAAVEAGDHAATRSLLWIESPGNPLMSITDIAACAEIAHRARRCCWASTTPSPRRC